MTIEELENLYPYSCDTEAEYRVFKWIINNYKLINKRVETTNEQPKKDFKCKGIYKYPGACGLEQECTCL